MNQSITFHSRTMSWPYLYLKCDLNKVGGFSPIGLQRATDLVSNLLWRGYLRMTQQSWIAVCRGLEKKELEQWPHVSASRKPVLMVSCMYASKSFNCQACHPPWKRKGQKAMGGDAEDIGMTTEIKSHRICKDYFVSNENCQFLHY